MSLHPVRSNPWCVILSVILVAILMVPSAYCQEPGLSAELERLTKKYGAESVARALERQSPQAVAVAKKDVRVPEDAIASPKKENPGFGGFLIRRTYSDVTSAEDASVNGPAASYEKALGAEFSYTRDYLSNSTEWAAVASVIRPIKLYSLDDTNNDRPSEKMVLNSLHLVPSISLHRVSNRKNPANDVDSLIFRTGLFAETAGGPGPLSLMVFRLSASYASNTHLDDGIVAGELDWEPLTTIPGNLAPARLIKNGTGEKGKDGSLIEYLWRFYLHSEGGSDQRDTPISGSRDFFRAGPNVELTLDPFFSSRLSASVRYGYLYGFAGEPRESHHFLANLAWKLGPKTDPDHLTLNATYEDGDIPLVQEKVKTFLLSLGIKY